MLTRVLSSQVSLQQFNSAIPANDDFYEDVGAKQSQSPLASRHTGCSQASISGATNGSTSEQIITHLFNVVGSLREILNHFNELAFLTGHPLTVVKRRNQLTDYEIPKTQSLIDATVLAIELAKNGPVSANDKRDLYNKIKSILDGLSQVIPSVNHCPTIQPSELPERFFNSVRTAKQSLQKALRACICVT